MKHKTTEAQRTQSVMGYVLGALGALVVLGVSVLILQLSNYPTICMSAQSCAPTTYLTPRRAFSAAWLAGRVYAVGGWNGDATQLNIVESLDATNSHNLTKWQREPTLIHARSQHALVVANGALWVLGGWSANGGLVSAVERFEPTQATWRIVTHLPTPRREPAAALLGRRIIVAGGFDGASDGEIDAYLGVVEAYDLDTQRWTKLASLRTPRRGLTMVALDAQLYAIGGFNADDGYLNTIERYDAASNTWQTLNWPIAPRTWTATVVVNEQIIIIGGYNRNGFLNLVERVDPRTGRVCHPPPLRVARSWLAAVPLDDQVLTLGGEEAHSIGNTLEIISGTCQL